MNDVKQENNIRVRFAPSPTGFLHVGGARTAIFNWLFAKNQNGKFLLRIEDTDPERSKSELSQQIIRSMDWLGIKSDEPIVYQSDRIERYCVAVLELLKNKKAYYAFETPDELNAKRKESHAKKIPFKYDRAALNLSGDEVIRNLDDGKPFAVRFKVPDGETEFDDIVHGKTSFQNSEIDDFVLLRSDGSPVYQIAVVVDDHDMKISHVIRGDDHLSNTPKQILIYKALGWDVPKFAHLPMILDEEKKKLSKRRNTVAVEDYKDKGYLPEALFNFLTLLGFAAPPRPSPKERKNEGENNREIISREELVNEFTFDRVNKSSAVFNTKKLAWLNSEYIRKTDVKILCGLLSKILAKNKIEKQKVSYLIKAIELMKERVNTINDFYLNGKYFFAEPESYDEKGIEKYWNEEAKVLMKEYLEKLKGLTSPPAPLLKGEGSEKFNPYLSSQVYDSSKSKTRGEREPEGEVIKSKGEGSEIIFNAVTLEEHLRKFAETKNIKPAVLIHPLRLAMTGGTVSPGIFELMEVLGRETVIYRIEKFINHH